MNFARLGLAVMIASLVFMAACQAPQNSVSQDPQIYGAQPANVTGSALAILARNCVQCHANFGRWSESDFRTHRTRDGRNWIVAGDLGASALYQKLRGVSAAGNMPPSGAISAEERSTLAVWILSMKPIPAAPPEPTPIPAPSPALTPVPGNTPAPSDTPAALCWKKVQAIVGNRCARCHDEFVGVSEIEFIRQVAVPGNLGASPVFKRISSVDPDFQMPPPGSGAEPGTTLPADEIAVFREWITEYAPLAH